MSIPQPSILYKTTYSMAMLAFSLFVMWQSFSLFNIEKTVAHIQLWFIFCIYLEVVETALVLRKTQAVELMEGKGK